MKNKIIAAACALSICFSVSACAVENELGFEDYKYTADGTLTLIDEPEKQGYLSIPTDLNGTKITRLADGLLENSEYEEIDVNEPVVSIGKRAFAGSSKLVSVWFGSKEKITFGEDCFADTLHLSLYFPCTNDIWELQEEIKRVKGDEDFYINIWHDYDDTGHCVDCGDNAVKNPPIVEANFSDVPEDSWYYEYVNIAYSLDVLNGKSEGIFDPEANMTLGEAAKIAACMHSKKIGNTEEFMIGEPWYEYYVDYCYFSNIIEEHISFDWEKPATRAEMAYIFSRADTESYEVNPDVPLTDIPDVHDTTPFAYEILDLYRRGVAVGSDENMTFYPDSNVKRSEAAAFIARTLLTSMRIELPKG